jgi:hypothetical protein
MLKLVWDTSALVNIKEPNEHGYSPGHSLWKDLADGWIEGPYQNIIPQFQCSRYQPLCPGSSGEGLRFCVNST